MTRTKARIASGTKESLRHVNCLRVTIITDAINYLRAKELFFALSMTHISQTILSSDVKAKAIATLILNSNQTHSAHYNAKRVRKDFKRLCQKRLKRYKKALIPQYGKTAIF